MLKKLKIVLILAAVFAVAGCKAEVENETPKCTISYEANGHGTAPDAKTVEKGYKLTAEDLPNLTENGFNFVGWENEGTAAAAGDVVDSDITLTAVWTEWGKVATPAFSVAEGEVDYGDKVRITCATEGASIYYTLDESEPTASSTKYTDSITITKATTIKAIAVKSGMNNSAVAEKSYTLKLYTVTFDANGHGTATSPITGKHKGETVALPAALTATGFAFGGWNDGTTTYTAGANYTVAGNVTMKAVWTEWSKVSAPVLSAADSQIDYNETVAITTTTEGAEIYYTIDGSNPSAAAGTKYTEPVAITAGCTLKAIAVKTGLTDSDVTAKTYTIKLYTVTFDANGHGTAPSPITGKHKGETVALPAALIATGFIFGGWNDGTTTYTAGADYTVTGNITIKAVWKDGTPPANVTNLTAKCTASQTVKLTWENPTDADFEKVVITYGTDGKVEVLKTANPNNEETIIGLTDGTEYTFTVKACDNAGNASSGVDVKCKLGKLYTPATNSNGGLEGYTNQTQGEVVKETWMDSEGNKKIGETAIPKTSEVVAVPTGTVATVTMPDDSSWSSYYSGTSSVYKGVFLKDRKVKLDPFVMSQYEVTQKLYNEVMGNNPSTFKNSPYGSETQENRPVENVTWYQACAFCNELSKKTFGATTDQCVYYSDETLTAPYSATDAGSYKTPYIAYSTADKKWTKKGYRLPTEAEWEFAARGGDPNAEAWSYAYAGSQTKKEASKFTSSPYNDDELESYAWYNSNASKKTHEVGIKEKNTLNLYDMSGNVNEWCYDWFNDTASQNDSEYTVDGYVQNPVGASASDSSLRCCRGGSYSDYGVYCAVSRHSCSYPDDSGKLGGFRVCRSTQ